MDTLKELAELLQTYGGWGISVILMAWIYFKEKVRQKERKETAETFNQYHLDIVKITSNYASVTKSFAAELRDLDGEPNKKSLSDYIPKDAQD